MRVQEGLRVWVRLITLFCWTITLFVFRLLAKPVRWVSPAGERAVRGRVFRCWGRGALRIIGCEVELAGVPPLPPYFFVSNHLSYVDGIVYAALLGEVFVGMQEIRGWPLIGSICAGMDTLFIERQRPRDVFRVNAEIVRVYDSGAGVIVFVESTTSFGQHVLPFKPALLQGPAERGIPVHFASIRYYAIDSDPEISTSVCWVDDTPFVEHALRLLRRRRYGVRVQFGVEPISADDRKVLARMLEESVEVLLHKGQPDSVAV